MSFFPQKKQPLQWRQIQKTNFTEIESLSDFLELSFEQRQKLSQRPSFPLNLPRRLASKIQKGTLDDPIFRQFVPLLEEEVLDARFLASPVCDESFQKTSKLLQKYKGRVLLIPTSACAMNCRFCFRQNYPYNTESKKNFEQELEFIKNDPSLFEVIISGGDPLSLSDEVLKNLIQDLENIPHVKILRFHTRFLMGIPERITDSFLDILKNTRLQVVFITHCNHAKELDEDVQRALKTLKQLGVTLLSHTVLLKGVNDDFETLHALFQKLIFSGVMPYYLNQLDLVKGSAHFEVLEEKGLNLMKQLRESLPGYAVPKYIREVPHEKSKTLLF